MTILGIKRAAVFSPNMTSNDDAIIAAVAEELSCLGHKVIICTEEKFANGMFNDIPIRFDRIFTMMRSEDALEALQKMEKQGSVAVNPSMGIRNAERIKITQLQIKNNIPIPRTVFVNTDEIPDIPSPCWIKRGSGWTTEPGDVRFAASHNEAERIIHEMRTNHPDEPLVVVEHLQGDLLKFYGVEGTDFFYWYYPDPLKSKFQLEQINGAAHEYPFDEQALKTDCNRLARAACLPVYGGDAIISPDGSFRIIDFNDWPSFSPCRQQAAKAIAKILTLK